MKWIRTSLQLGQAVKNVQRLRQIISVFAKHGYADVVRRIKLGKFLPTRMTTPGEEEGISALNTPEHLRMAFEELGPTFVKLGQLLSTRPDLIPEAYISELVKLQDNVQPLPFDVVKTAVERELGKTLSEAFASFESTPLAAASISQVHEARLHTGEKVVVKVQRPEIEKLIENDISLLAFLAGLLEKYVPESRVIGPRIVVDEFFRTLSFELDFVVEANNISRMAENLKVFPDVVVPRVYRHLSTERILTQEKFEGIRVNDIAALDAAGINRKQVVQVGSRAFFKSIMIDGLFHGDLHGGNLFILPGNRLGIIDFGIVGRLSEKSRAHLANMLMALLTEDYENLCFQYAELGMSGPSIDFDSFQREVRNTLEPYMGLTLQEMNAGKILIEATKIAAKYQIKVPGDWMLVFKSIFTIEGMGRTLDPEFDLISSGQDLIKDLVKNQYSMQRLSKDFLWIAKDVAALLQILPRQIRWMFRKWNSDDFAFEIKVPQMEEIRQQLDVNGRRMSLSIITAGLFIAASIALYQPSAQQILGTPFFSAIFMALGSLFLLRLFFKSF